MRCAGTLLGIAVWLAACGLPDRAERVATSCAGAPRWATPEDPAARGPWAVGARTATIAGLTTEIWYPAPPGSDRGHAKARYDIREQLPDYDQGKIPDADNPWLDCACVRELPIDEAHGPYPLVLFLHGTAGFRSQSLSFMTHWASRGFVVVAADHPFLMMKDILQFHLGADQAGDAARLLDAIAGAEVEFLRGRVATDRVAIAGHSAGGLALTGFSSRPGVQVLIPMAGGGVAEGTVTRSALLIGALDDMIVPYARYQVAGYEATTTPLRRLVGIGNAGHLAFSEICALGADRGGLLEIAVNHDIFVSPLIRNLAQDGCGKTQLAPARGWEIVKAATAAALEETLTCSTTAAARMSGLQAKYPDVVEEREDVAP